MVTLNAHFDGKSIVLDEPLPSPIKPGTRLKVSIQAAEPTLTVTPTPRVFRPLDIHVDPELSKAIASDPAFNIEEA